MFRYMIFYIVGLPYQWDPLSGSIEVHPGIAIVRTREKQQWQRNGLKNEPSTSRYHHFRGNLKTNPILMMAQVQNMV